MCVGGSREEFITSDCWGKGAGLEFEGCGWMFVFDHKAGGTSI